MRLAAMLSPILAASFIQAGEARAAQNADLAAHTATYALTLRPGSDQNVIAATGTMRYEVTDVCTGWTTAQHLVIDLTNKDGQDIRMVSDYATLESKDGRHLEFHTRQVTDTAVTEQLDGSATLDRAGKGTASFTVPQQASVVLPAGTLLPIAHTEAIIAAARAGKKFFAAPLFDGTDKAGAEDTFVTVEGLKPPGGAGSDTASWAGLASLSSVRVHVAFFDRAGGGSETPTYEIGMQYLENGVANNLAMNFGDFAMQGVLSKFALHAPSRC